MVKYLAGLLIRLSKKRKISVKISVKSRGNWVKKRVDQEQEQSGVRWFGLYG